MFPPIGTAVNLRLSTPRSSATLTYLTDAAERFLSKLMTLQDKLTLREAAF